MKLSAAQKKALALLIRDGSVEARNGISAATLRALARLGIGSYAVLGGVHVLHSYVTQRRIGS